MTFTMFSGTWSDRTYLEVPYFESPAAWEYSAPGHPDLPVQPQVLRTSEKIPDWVRGQVGRGQHGTRAGTVCSLHPIPGTSGASGKRSPLRCAALGAAR